MSLEKDITGLKEADIFQGASPKEVKRRLAQKARAEKDIPKDMIVSQLDKSLGYQFEGYSWSQMINDTLTDDRGFTQADRDWAEENVSYKAYRTDIAESVNEKDIFKGASKKEVEDRKRAAGSIWVSLRTVRATDEAAAIEKIILEDFETDHPLCDRVIPAKYIMVRGWPIEEAVKKDIFKGASPEELATRKEEAKKKLAVTNAEKLKRFNKNKAAYLEHPEFCPYCESDDINTHQEFPEYGTIYETMTCGNCNNEWTEVYKLTGVEPVLEED